MATELRRLQRREGPEDVPELMVEGKVFRKAKRILIPIKPEEELPNRCVCCGSESEENEPVTKELRWVEPIYLVLGMFVLFPLLLIVFYFSARKGLKLTWWLCPRHHAESRKVRIAALTLFFTSVPLLIACGIYNSDAFGAVGGLCLLGAVVAAIRLGAYGMRIANYRDDRIDLSGGRKPFLDTLPEAELNKDRRVSW